MEIHNIVKGVLKKVKVGQEISIETCIRKWMALKRRQCIPFSMPLILKPCNHFSIGLKPLRNITKLSNISSLKPMVPFKNDKENHFRELELWVFHFITIQHPFLSKSSMVTTHYSHWSIYFTFNHYHLITYFQQLTWDFLKHFSFTWLGTMAHLSTWNTYINKHMHNQVQHAIPITI